MMRKILSIVLFAINFVLVHGQTDIKFIQSQEDSIFYEVKGMGLPVLFLSGGPGGSPYSLSPIVDYVISTNRAILLHQRGTGLSSHNKIDAETITLEQYVDDINNILQKEKIQEAYIVGHSWGAMLALDYMVKNPEKVKGLILIGASGYSLDFNQSMNNETFSRMTPSEIDTLKVYITQLNNAKDTDLINDIQSKMTEMIIPKQFYNPSRSNDLLIFGKPNMAVNSFIMTGLRNQNWNLGEKLKSIENPVVIINGDYDPIPKSSVRELKQSLRKSELHFLPDCGHYVWLEKPEELQKIIEEFLSAN